MANKFEKKEWEDRQVQYPSRRKLTPTGQENIYDVDRAEGEVTAPGNAFDAQNMNNLEDRVYDAFGKLDAMDIAVLDKSNVFTKTNVEEVLLELFTFASNGKKAFASAIGGSASSTFQVLANLAASIKQDRDSGKQLIASAIGVTRNGTASASETFTQLANRIKNDKMSFWSGKMPIDIDMQSLGIGAISTQQVNIKFGFSPSIILIENCLVINYYRTKYTPSDQGDEQCRFTSAISSLNTIRPEVSGTSAYISNMTENGFLITLKNDASYSSYVTKNNSFLHFFTSARVYAFR